MTRLPYALQRRGCTLLHQQCWLWGQDVRRTEGNLLLELGFDRVRPPAGQQGCTQYTRSDTTGELRLWGFGCYHRLHTGVYLNRYAFAPLAVTLQEDVWAVSSFPGKSEAVDHSSVAAMVRAVAAVEQQAQQAMGLAYRARCLYGWSKRALPPAALVPAWLALARDVEAYGVHLGRAVPTQHGPRYARRPACVA